MVNKDSQYLMQHWFATTECLPWAQIKYIEIIIFNTALRL